MKKNTLTKQIVATLVALLVFTCLFELTPVDILVQDYFFNFQSLDWLVDREEAISKLIFYDGFKKLYGVFVIGLLIALIFLKNNLIIKQYKKGLIIVLLSCILVPVFIGYLKSITNIPCPKNIAHYSGNYPYVTLLTAYPSAFHQERRIKCFPAGHASGGFALMSLFFLFKLKKNRKIALATAVTIGWSTGTYKMLIGDHFIGHTVTTMILAWLVILLIAQGANKFNAFRIYKDARQKQILGLN
jgi:membrane-associated PAP2 superfamily phosphatase